MEIQELFAWWGDQSAAANYDVNLLSADDARRSATRRGAKALLDWQVSRAVLQDVRRAVTAPGAMSLSHSRGCAICVSAPTGWKVGIDLEAIRPRDVPALAEWVCSSAERDALARLSGDAQQQLFYRLWTLKEAFIKAAGLDFPADMASVGLEPAQDGMTLRGPAGQWEGCSYRLDDDWMASVVWQRPPEAACARGLPGWRGAAGCSLPSVNDSLYWRVGNG